MQADGSEQQEQERVQQQQQEHVQVIDNSAHAKVCNLNDEVVSHKAVARSEVSVDAVVLLEVRHPVSHLRADVPSIPWV
jgi:hypothetical protein